MLRAINSYSTLANPWYAAGTAIHVQITFSEPVDLQHFTPSAITLTGPAEFVFEGTIEL